MRPNRLAEQVSSHETGTMNAHGTHPHAIPDHWTNLGENLLMPHPKHVDESKRFHECKYLGQQHFCILGVKCSEFIWVEAAWVAHKPVVAVAVADAVAMVQCQFMRVCKDSLVCIT